MFSSQEIQNFIDYPIQPPAKFMTAYERLEWVIPEVQPEVWDIIMVFKKAAEERDRKIAEAKANETILRKLINIRGMDNAQQKDYCKTNKISKSYRMCSTDAMRWIRIVFATFNRKMPSGKNFPPGSGSGLRWSPDMAQTWEDEDRNLYLLARHMEDGPLSWGRFEESTNYYKPLLSGKGVEVYHHYDEMVISGRK